MARSASSASSATAATRPATSAAKAQLAAAVSVNPVTGNQGFNVFVAGNATLNSTSVGGPVALGGNLTLGSGSFNVATQSARTIHGIGPTPGRPGCSSTADVNWAGSGANGTVNVQNNGFVKVGDMTGSAVAQSGTAATHVVRAGQGYSSLPQIAAGANQPTASVNQSGLVGFSSAFSTFRSNSTNLAACPGTVVLTAANGTPLPATIPPGTNAFVTLNAGVHILNITAANLANIAILNFRNSPSASTPLIINVDTAGSGNTFTWSPPNFNSVGGGDVAFIMWNFPTATTLTISGSSTIPGTIYAPAAAVIETDQNGINGGVIAAAYTQGGSASGGQVQSNPFAATVQPCSSTALTIALTADAASVAPGGTVHYTITATNSGSVAYTGATLTAPLSGSLTMPPTTATPQPRPVPSRSAARISAGPATWQSVPSRPSPTPPPRRIPILATAC